MSSAKREGRTVVKPLVVAIALALPGAASFAASMDDVVKTRADQNIDEQYGRDSVYAFSRDAKPLKPEQQGSHDMGFIGDAYHKTTGFLAGAWHKTTSMFDRDNDGSKTYAANRYQLEPQRYGRAGGYVGSERVAVIAGTTDMTATANAETVKDADTVKTGQELDNAAVTPAPAITQDQPSSAAVTPEPSAPVNYEPTAPTVQEPNSAVTRDESQPVITAPVVQEQPVIERTDSAARTDELPPQPLDQSPTANGDVVHTSPMPPSDNGRADSANTPTELDSQTR